MKKMYSVVMVFEESEKRSGGHDGNKGSESSRRRINTDKNEKYYVFSF
jgi:hypothetical protein